VLIPRMRALEMLLGLMNSCPLSMLLIASSGCVRQRSVVLDQACARQGARRNVICEDQRQSDCFAAAESQEMRFASRMATAFRAAPECADITAER
jgi:hypothetical protein